jgi:hypothetical protein
MSVASLSRFLVMGSLWCALQPAWAAMTVLYDHTLGGAAAAQGWLAGARTPGASETVTPDGTRLDSTTNDRIYAGYSNYDFGIQIAPLDIYPTRFKNPLFPVLDRAAGFTLTITAQLDGLVNDGPNGPNRGGFNITLLGADREGIEIGFQSDQIFAQGGVPFVAGETTTSAGQNPAALDVPALMAAMTTYDLTIHGDRYVLATAGQSLLAGNVRDYTSASGFGTSAYRTGSFLFLGDNTTSAGGRVTLGNVALTTPVPEPGTPLVCLLGIALVALWRRRAASR